jgi:uncharacterized delta-60 repeat protein
MNRLALAAAFGLAVAAIPAFAQTSTSFGETDPNFHPIASAYTCVGEIAVASDQSVFKMMLGFGGSGWGVAKFDADGSLDNAWGHGGVATVPNDASRIIPMPDGTVIMAIGGRLSRFTSAGTLDATFGDSGSSGPITASSSGYVNSLAVQSDGSILVLSAGNDDTYTVAPNNLAMTRILPNGRRDTSFGTSGYIPVTVPTGAAVYAWSLLSDGSIELGYMTADASGAVQPKLHRYPADFVSPPARVMPHVGIASWTAPTVGIDGYGGAVFATESNPYGTTSPQIVLTRFSPAGVRDASFGTNGSASIAVHGFYSLDPSTAVSKMLWQDPDGSWTLLADIGQSRDGWAMVDAYFSTLAVRFRADGSAEPQFPQGKDLGGGQLNKLVQLQTGELLHAEPTSAGCKLVKQTSDAPRADALMVEYYHPTLGHYFMTLEGAESRFLDANTATWGWQRTGWTFGAWLPVKLPGTTPLCRFYGDPVIGPNSHFYTPTGGECDFLESLQATTPPGQPAWRLEGLAAAVALPTNGECVGNLSSVYRLYNDGFAHGRDSNHRYTADPALYAQMQAQGWLPEGVAFCVPLPSSRASLF